MLDPEAEIDPDDGTTSEATLIPVITSEMNGELTATKDGSLTFFFSHNDLATAARAFSTKLAVYLLDNPTKVVQGCAASFKYERWVDTATGQIFEELAYRAYVWLRPKTKQELANEELAR